MDNVENGIILSPEGPNFEGRPRETKDYCMTRFFGHGQPIIQVFETAIALSMVKSMKSQFFPTLLVPISWTLAICVQQPSTLFRYIINTYSMHKFEALS